MVIFPPFQNLVGTVVLESVSNLSILGNNNWDTIAIQEWKDSEAFDKWWNSDEYKPWSEIRDKASNYDIIKCENFKN